MPPGIRRKGAEMKLFVYQLYIKKLKKVQSKLRRRVDVQLKRTLNNHTMLRESFESDNLAT